jgi:hypothetical protein
MERSKVIQYIIQAILLIVIISLLGSIMSAANKAEDFNAHYTYLFTSYLTLLFLFYLPYLIANLTDADWESQTIKYFMYGVALIALIIFISQIYNKSYSSGKPSGETSCTTCLTDVNKNPFSETSPITESGFTFTYDASNNLVENDHLKTFKNICDATLNNDKMYTNITKNDIGTKTRMFDLFLEKNPTITPPMPNPNVRTGENSTTKLKDSITNLLCKNILLRSTISNQFSATKGDRNTDFNLDSFFTSSNNYNSPSGKMYYYLLFFVLFFVFIVYMWNKKKLITSLFSGSMIWTLSTLVIIGIIFFTSFGVAIDQDRKNTNPNYVPESTKLFLMNIVILMIYFLLIMLFSNMSKKSSFLSKWANMEWLNHIGVKAPFMYLLFVILFYNLFFMVLSPIYYVATFFLQKGIMSIMQPHGGWELVFMPLLELIVQTIPSLQDLTSVENKNDLPSRNFLLSNRKLFQMNMSE